MSRVAAWALLALGTVGCANNRRQTVSEPLLPEGRAPRVVSAENADWAVRIKLEPWQGVTEPSAIVAYGFIDRGDDSNRGGMNPVPSSFVLTYRGKPVLVPYAMYCDLFYLNEISIEPKADGCILNFGGADAGGSYAGKIFVTYQEGTAETPARYFASRRVAWTRGGEAYRSEILW